VAGFLINDASFEGDIEGAVAPAFVVLSPASEANMP
jgi:hypothetical protein